MGGYGTLIHGLSNPDKYAALGAFSAAVKLNLICWTIWLKRGEFDPLTIAKEQTKKGKSLPKLYIACGQKDFLFEANVDFRDQMKALGADVTWVNILITDMNGVSGISSGSIPKLD